MNRTLLFIFFLSITLSSRTFSQDVPPPITWGEIEMADLEMTSFPKDSNASAVVLCDFGTTKMMDDFSLKFTRHLRVKILNEKGFRWGTFSLTVDSDKDNGEYLDDIEAVTYVLDEKKKIREVELDDDDIFEEKVSDELKRHKFTLPGLKPGCIIEVKYSIVSRSLAGIRGWVFQDDEPVLWSEYRLIHPTPIVFAVLSRGYEKYHINKQIEFKQYYSNEVASYYGGNMVNCYFLQWAMKDIPALRSEPYITTLDDYTSKIELQLSAYALRGGGVQRVLNTWDKFVEEIYESKYLGEMINDPGDADDLAKALTDSLPAPLDKLKALYRFVSSNIAYNDHQTMWTSQTIDELLKSKKGSSAEINYLLVAMLRAVKITADPVILSTRGNGLIQELYPMSRQFNYGMARAVIAGTVYTLDATDPTRPMDMLPSKVQGVRALIIKPGQSQWYTLMSPQGSITSVYANITLDAGGSVRGTIDGIFKQYANLDGRSSLKASKPEDFAKRSFSLNASGLTLDSVVVVNKDSAEKPLILKAWVSSDAYAQSNGDLLYINPHMISRWDENPFKTSVRKFPVDYNYPREFSTTVNLTIPDSFEVKERLSGKRIPLGNDAVYTRMFQTDGRIVQLVSKLEIISRVIPSASYDKLRDLYAAMIQSETDQIVLQKVPPPPPPVVVPAAPEPPKKNVNAKRKK